MTDRELLELAARAAGLDLEWCEPWRCMAKNLGESNGFDSHTCWDSLKDDGDALRLAVKLRLSIIQEEEFVLGEYLQTVEVMSEEREDWSRICIMQSLDDEPMAATRRAITRAAAEIGKTMQ